MKVLLVQVLIPQKLFLMASRAASFPLMSLSLAEEASVVYDDLTQCITIKVIVAS